MNIIYILITSLLLSLTIVGISYLLHMIWSIILVKVKDNEDVPKVLITYEMNV